MNKIINKKDTNIMNKIINKKDTNIIVLTVVIAIALGYMIYSIINL